MIIKILPVLLIYTLCNTQLYSACINYNKFSNVINQNDLSIQQIIQNNQKPVYIKNINNINDVLEIKDNKFIKKVDDVIDNYINNITNTKYINNSISNKKPTKKHRYSRDSLSTYLRKQNILKRNNIKFAKKSSNIQNINNYKSYNTKVIDSINNKKLSINDLTIEEIVNNKNKLINLNNKNDNSMQYCEPKKYYISNNYIMDEYFKYNGNISINEIIRRAHKVVLLEGKVIINNYKKLPNFNPKLDMDKKIQKIIFNPNNNINIYQYKTLYSYTTPNKKPDLKSYNNNHSDYNNIKLKIDNHNNNNVINNGRNLLTEYNNQNIYNYNMVTPPNNRNKVQNPMIISINISEEQNNIESEKTNNDEYMDRLKCSKNLLEQFNECNNNYKKCDSTNYKTEEQNSKNKLENKQNNDEIKRNLYNTIINDELED